MATLKEQAEQYVPKTIKNISELSEVSVDVQVMDDGEGLGNEGPYTYSYVEINGERYKVPATVLQALKEILEAKPNLKKFRVSRTGTTRQDTRYTVIQLD